MSTSEIVYHGRVFDLRVDTEPGGFKREIVVHPGSVGLVALLEEGPDARVILVRQSRPATGKTLLEIPAGTREPGEDPAATARRELPEETGYACRRLEHLGGFYLCPGYSSEYMDLFLATELYEAAAGHDEDEDIELVILPLVEAVAQARQGEFSDVKTVTGLLMVAGRRQV